MQRLCCLCRIHPAVLQANGVPLSNKTSSFVPVATLLCQACHNETSWQPRPKNLYLSGPNRVSLLGPSFMPNMPSTLAGNSSELCVHSAALYLGYIRSALIAFKYQEQLTALPVLVHALRQLPKPTGCDVNNSVILPIPTTDNRLASRGFNPTIILAHYLAKHWHIPLWRGVGRHDDAANQQGLNQRERRQNMDNAFHLTARLPSNKHLILFDDVMTTGATLSALALSLQKSRPSATLLAYTLTRGK